jgi:excisionase family DNA binding protein
MVDPISISEAAHALKLSPARVRAMASGGQLSASKVGDRWLVERKAVEQRKRRGAHGGRRFAPRNAWALLMLSSDEEVEGIDPSVRSRLRRALALEGLQALAPRLGHRAEASLYRAHPGEIRHVVDDPALMRSGISAAGSLGIGLVSGREADGYLPEAALRGFIKEHALSQAEPDSNVRLRVVPDQAWAILGGRSLAPEAAVALDLMEESDPRSAKAGAEVLRKLDSHHPRR